MTHKFKLIAILTISIVLILCISYCNKFNDSSNKEYITKEQMIFDYNYLWETLDNNYSKFYIAENKYNVNTNVIKNKYLNIINNSNTILLSDFYLILDECLSNFKDGHLYVLDSMLYEYRYTLSNSNDIYEKDYIKKIFNNKNVKTSYEIIKKQSSDNLENNAKQITSPFLEINNLVFDKINTETAYIKISSFLLKNVKTDHNKLIDFYKDIANYKNLIIDIRGNVGGSDAYWKESIVLVNLKTDFQYDNFFIVKQGNQNIEYARSLNLEEVNIIDLFGN